MKSIKVQRIWKSLAASYSKDLEASYRKRAHASITDTRMLLPALGIWGATSGIIISPDQFLGYIYLVSAVLICAIAARMFYTPAEQYTGLIVLASGITLAQSLLLTATHQVEAFKAANEWNNSFVEITGTVRTAEKGENSQRIIVQGTKMKARNFQSPFDLPVSFTTYDSAEMKVGDTISVRGTLQATGSHYRIMRPTATLQHRGHEPATLAFKTRMREYTESNLDQDEAALVLGMTYGDDSGMSDETANDFRTTGLTHLTAVSGANISLVFVLGFRVLQYFRCHRTLNIMISTGAIVLYVSLVGAEPSVLRALCMGVLGALALISGTGRFSAPMLWVAVIALLMIEPRYALDYGFALSVIATAALIILAPALVIVFSTVMPRLISEILAIPISASLWCAPVMILMVQSYQTYSVPANIMATFIVAPVTIIGLLATVAIFLHLNSVPSLDALVQLLIQLAGMCCRALMNIAHWVSGLPLSVVPLEPSWRTMSLALIVIVLVTICGLKLRGHLERTAFYTDRGHDVHSW